VAQQVAEEFFEQGDIEKQQLHQEPIDMMNRRLKHKLPSMQVGFVDSICLPLYQVKKWNITMGVGIEGAYIFIHDIDKVERGLMVLFFGLVFPLSFPPGNLPMLLLLISLHLCWMLFALSKQGSV